MQSTWTDILQTYAAVGSLIVGAVGYFFIVQTFKLQASTLLSQQKLTKLEGEKIVLQYKPWFVFLSRSHPYSLEKINQLELRFVLKNADARELKVVPSNSNYGYTIQRDESFIYEYVLIDKEFKLQFKFDKLPKNTDKDYLTKVFFEVQLEYIDLLNNKYRQKITYINRASDAIKVGVPIMIK